MSMTRLTMLFHAVTGSTAIFDGPVVRTAGWSESVYYQTETTIPARIRQLMIARAGLLPQTAAIIGQRYQLVDGSSNTATERFAGSSGESTDVPMMAVLCAARSVLPPSVRHFSLRGIPDAWVVAGELVTTPTVIARFTNLFTVLAGAFYWKIRLKSAQQSDIVTVLSTGDFSLAQELSFTQGSALRMVRVRNEFGQSVKGIYRVATRTDSRTGKLANWRSQGVNARGRMAVVSYDFAAYGAGLTQISRTMTKKVGRSFFQFHGRQSAGK